MAAFQPFGAKPAPPAPPASPGKSMEGGSPPISLDLEVELSEWKELLQDVMGNVDKVDMLAVLQILKDAGLSKPSKAVGIGASDVKDMKGFWESLDGTERHSAVWGGSGASSHCTNNDNSDCCCNTAGPKVTKSTRRHSKSGRKRSK